MGVTVLSSCAWLGGSIAVINVGSERGKCCPNISPGVGGSGRADTPLSPPWRQHLLTRLNDFVYKTRNYFAGTLSCCRMCFVCRCVCYSGGNDCKPEEVVFGVISIEKRLHYALLQSCRQKQSVHSIGITFCQRNIDLAYIETICKKD